VKKFLEGLKSRFLTYESNWNTLLAQETWREFLSDWVHSFFYFDVYYLLPGKVNITALSNRKLTPEKLDEEDRTVLSLLRMSGVSIEELTTAVNCEDVRARLEGLPNSIADRIFKYWKQNPDLYIEFDIRPDPKDRQPFNNGPNLYIRIRNPRHRVGVPSSQRSRGFIWFFSFGVWFDSVKTGEGKDDDLIRPAS